MARHSPTRAVALPRRGRTGNADSGLRSHLQLAAHDRVWSRPAPRVVRMGPRAVGGRTQVAIGELGAAVHEPHTSRGLDNTKRAMWALLGSECLCFGALIWT